MKEASCPQNVSTRPPGTSSGHSAEQEHEQLRADEGIFHNNTDEEDRVEEARRQSISTTPGAFHVLLVPRDSPDNDIEDEEEQDIAASDLETGSGGGRSGSSDRADGELTMDQPAESSPDADEAADVARMFEETETVAVPVDADITHATALEAMPVVDALDVVSEDTSAVTMPPSVRRSSRATMESISTGSSDGDSKHGASYRNAVARKWAPAVVAVLIIAALALGLALTGSRSGSNSTSDRSGFEDRLVEMEIISNTTSEESGPFTSSSMSMGIRLPTVVPGKLSRTLVVGMSADDIGLVKIFRSTTRFGLQSKDGSQSDGPFAETASITLPDRCGGGEEQQQTHQEKEGSADIVIKAGAEGESFVVSYRNCVRFYTSPTHGAKRQIIRNREALVNNTAVAKRTDELLDSAALSSAVGASASATNGWDQRGRSLLAEDHDAAIEGFGSSIAYGPAGLHNLRYVIVGSDSGHVRVYRFVVQHSTTSGDGEVADWQRIDGGLLDPPPSATAKVGKAVVATTAPGHRFAVGYPSMGKVSLYQFTDDGNIGIGASNSNSRSTIRLIDEIHSDVDLFGRSLSLDVFGNFLVVGARGSVRAYWLRQFPSLKLVQAGDAIVGDGGPSDGPEFGTVVASGYIPQHSGGCINCPFVLDQQRVAISSPAYGDRRGRVLLYQYDEDTGGWHLLASPVEGEAPGDGMGHSALLSPDMGLMTVSTEGGDVRAFSIVPEK